MFRNLLGQRKKPQEVAKGKFEIEQDGHVAYLEYTIAGNILGLLHTEVPTSLRGKGLSSELVRSALEWARENHMKVDVVCPTVAAYLERHHEFDDLLLH